VVSGTAHVINNNNNHSFFITPYCSTKTKKHSSTKWKIYTSTEKKN